MLSLFHKNLLNQFKDLNGKTFTNINETLSSLIEVECPDIKLGKKGKKLIQYLTLENNKTNLLLNIIKILFYLYRLKYKLHLILGKYTIDFEIYIDTENIDDDWCSFVLDDKYSFKNTNPIYLEIKNPVHFHYKHLIYDDLSRINLKNNKLVDYYYNLKQDEDLFNFIDLVINTINVQEIKDYIVSKTSLGKIKFYLEKDEIPLDKNCYIDQISELIISFRNNYEGIRERIIYDDNILCFENNLTYNEDEKSVYNNLDIKEFVFQNSLQHHYNIIDFLENIPLSYPVHNFNLNLNKVYRLEECIQIFLNGINLLGIFKLKKLTDKNIRLSEFKNLVNKMKLYNNGLYDSLCCIYSKIYYYIFINENIYEKTKISLKNSYISRSFYNQIISLNLKDLKELNFVKEFMNEIQSEDLSTKADVLDIKNWIRLEKYLPTYSLNQIITVYNSDNERKKSLIELIVKVIFGNVNKNVPIYYKPIESIIMREETDEKIYESLSIFVPEKFEEFDRVSVRVKQINSVLESKEFELLNKKDLIYLDFGGGNGEITSAISEKIKNKKENSFCVDVISWFDNTRENLYENISFKYINSNKLDFKDNSVKFITCFQVLHHIKNYQDIIKEFYRVMIPGAILIIREHDSRDSLDSILIDIEHSLYETTMKKKDSDNNLKYLNKYEAYYTSKNELLNLMLQNKFKDITTIFDSKLSVPVKATRYYYSVFTK